MKTIIFVSLRSASLLRLLLFVTDVPDVTDVIGTLTDSDPEKPFELPSLESIPVFLDLFIFRYILVFQYVTSIRGTRKNRIKIPQTQTMVRGLLKEYDAQTVLCFSSEVKIQGTLRVIHPTVINVIIFKAIFLVTLNFSLKILQTALNLMNVMTMINQQLQAEPALAKNA